MIDKELKRILNNLREKLFFSYIGDFTIFDLSKEEIKNLTKAIKETDKENPNNKEWERDRELLKIKINKWCDVFRCPSLIID